MIILVESIILCLVFTIMVYIMSRDPIKTLYNYPPKIQKKVKSLSEYKDKIPTNENKIVAKIAASIIFLIIICFILRYINGYTTFLESFGYGFLLWTIVNLWDVIVLDIIWFCHDKHFIFKGTEDMTDEYHNYWFYIKGFFIGEMLAVVICSLAALMIHFVLWDRRNIVEKIILWNKKKIGFINKINSWWIDFFLLSYDIIYLVF